MIQTRTSYQRIWLTSWSLTLTLALARDEVKILWYEVRVLAVFTSSYRDLLTRNLVCCTHLHHSCWLGRMQLYWPSAKHSILLQCLNWKSWGREQDLINILVLQQNEQWSKEKPFLQRKFALHFQPHVQAQICCETSSNKGLWISLSSYTTLSFL